MARVSAELIGIGVIGGVIAGVAAPLAAPAIGVIGGLAFGAGSALGLGSVLVLNQYGMCNQFPELARQLLVIAALFAATILGGLLMTYLCKITVLFSAAVIAGSSPLVIGFLLHQLPEEYFNTIGGLLSGR